MVSNAPESVALAAGHSATARLTSDPDGFAMVAVGTMPPIPVVPRARAASFAPAHNAPILYGASSSGGVVVVMCNVITATISMAVHPVFGLSVQSVAAASQHMLLFVCSQRNVWLLNIKKPTTVTPVGRLSPSGVLVAAFASNDVAVMCSAHPEQAVNLIVVSTKPHIQATWGVRPVGEVVDAPSWAASCTASVNCGRVTAYVGGAVVMAAQLEAQLAGPSKFRARSIMTARRCPVTTVALRHTAMGSFLLCRLQSGKLMQLSSAGRENVGTCRALSSTGHFF